MATSYALLVTEPSRQRAFQQLISVHGLNVSHASDGASALRTVSVNGPPALIITELELPKLDGFKLLESLRAQKVTAPAIAVSSFLEMRNQALQRKDALGIVAIVSPGMSMDTLARAIARTVGGEKVDRLPAPRAARTYDHPQRLSAIEASGLVDDGPPDAQLQALLANVAKTYGVETALISIVLKDRQWFKAYSGLAGKLLTERGTPIEQAFCRHAVNAASPLVVPDARVHPLFTDNALVTGGTIRGYAGVPLQTSAGAVVGTLCVLDSKVLTLDAEQLESLRLMGRRVAGELELRLDRSDRKVRLQSLLDAMPATDQGGEAHALRLLESVLSSLDLGVMLMSGTDRRVLYANNALGMLAGLPATKIIGMTRDQWVAQNTALFDDPSEFLHKLKVLPAGPFAASEVFSVQRPVSRIIRWTARPLRVDAWTYQLATYEELESEAEILE